VFGTGLPAALPPDGFHRDDIAQLGDRLIDGFVAWGADAAIAARVTEQQQAGADHVAVMLFNAPEQGAGWAALARRLLH
jgi:hypothetical protein